MRKMVLAVLTAALLAATGGMLYSSGEAFGATQTCTGTLPGSTINANIYVPSGSVCTISGQTVNGNITVEPGGGLVLLDSKVNGNVSAMSPGSFAGNPCGIGTGNFSVVVASSTITGTLTVTGAPADVLVGGGACGRNFIQNNVTLNNNTGFVSLQNATVTGNASVQNNTGPTPIVATNHVSNILYCSPATGSGNTAKTIYGSCTA